jgi:hypothetical protein
MVYLGKKSLFWDEDTDIKFLRNPNLTRMKIQTTKYVRFLCTISNDPDRVAYNHEYTQIYIKISSFKRYIYKLFLYFYRNSDTENNSSLFKTYAVD